MSTARFGLCGGSGALHGQFPATLGTDPQERLFPVYRFKQRPRGQQLLKTRQAKGNMQGVQGATTEGISSQCNITICIFFLRFTRPNHTTRGVAAVIRPCLDDCRCCSSSRRRSRLEYKSACSCLFVNSLQQKVWYGFHPECDFGHRIRARPLCRSNQQHRFA